MPGIGAPQCNTTLLSSTFNSVWSVCRMRKKFLGNNRGRGSAPCTELAALAQKSNLLAHDRKTFTLAPS